jgi:hypothetical protein
MRLFLASFLGFLADPAFLREEASALDLMRAAGLNPWELVYLAGAHAHGGDMKRALEVLRSILRNGRLTGRIWLTVAAPTLLNTPGLEDRLREYDAEERRRLSLYAPAS